MPSRSSRPSRSSSSVSNPFNRHLSSESSRVSRLTAELQASQRSANVFHDGRIISEDSRLTAVVSERLRSVGKSNKFERLTHGGKSLDKIEHSHKEDEDEPEQAALHSLSASELVSLAGLSRDQGASKREIMQEVIAKSKLFKAERAAEQDAQKERLNEIDEEFKEIQTLLEFKSEGEGQLIAPVEDYFTESKKLLVEPRAAASERIKSEQETAQEAREKLEKLENLRKQRMNGIEKDEKSAAGDDELNQQENVLIDKESRKRKREQEESNEIQEKQENQQEENDDHQVENESSLIESESSQVLLSAFTRVSSSSDSSIPYLFDCPATYCSLFDLLSPHPFSCHRLIIERILACTHLALKPENRGKLQRFHSLLFVHAIKLTDATEAKMVETSILVEQLNWLTVILFQLSESLGGPVIARIRRRLANTRTRLLDSGEPLKLSDLIHFSLLSRCFPMTDYRHNITTPLLLLCSELLARRSVESLREAAETTWFITLLLEPIQQAKRFIPEVIHGLQKVARFIEKALQENKETEKIIAKLDWKTFNNSVLPLSMMCGDPQLSAALLLNLLGSFLFFVDHLSPVYSDLPSYPELFHSLFSSVSSLYSSVNTSKWSRVNGLLTSLTRSKTQIQDKISNVSSNRRPLTLLHRSILTPAIRTNAPAFVEQYNGADSLDPIKERVRVRQLQRKIKLEKKGAIKQVKSESHVFNQQFSKLRHAREQNWQKKARKNWAELEQQQRDTNLLAKVKRKKKN
jgi:nucleolar protein 14